LKAVLAARIIDVLDRRGLSVCAAAREPWPSGGLKEDSMPEPQARTIADLAALDYVDRHIRARYAAVHRTDEMQAGIYELAPGGRIPAHRHSASWDFAVVLDGEIEARIGAGEGARVVRCGAHAINLVPPGTVHELRNVGDAPARFLLVQSPSRGFDFLREGG